MNNVSFHGSASDVPQFGRYELEARPSEPPVHPFSDVRLHALVTTPGGEQWRIEGFCDADNGSVYRLRIMPTEPGPYSVAARFQIASAEGTTEWTHESAFTCIQSDHPGVIVLDPDYPEHLMYSGSGEHYFWNGTTAYYLMGWKDETQIDSILSRLASKGVNRVRVLLYGRAYDRPWRQPVRQTEEFSLNLEPWPARFPEDVSMPGFDLSRFVTEYWRKFERLLDTADGHGIVVSVCFFIGAQPLAVPFATWSEDEIRYYRYAIARLAAFPNVMWDLGNEHNFHRDNFFWVQTMGAELQRRDVYGHIAGIHNRPYHKSWGGWQTVQLLQSWDVEWEAHIAQSRLDQAATGRVIPQILEEYGYEDLWEETPHHRSAETRRRVCWEAALSGIYQTNGESTRTGTGFEPNTGGGWINGRGDDSLTMFDSIKPMVDFFRSFDWWRFEPRNDLALHYHPDRTHEVEYFHKDGRRALHQPARVLMKKAGPSGAAGNGNGDQIVMVIYLPCGGSATISIPFPLHDLTVRIVNPRTGTREAVETSIESSEFRTPYRPGPEDVVFLLQR